MAHVTHRDKQCLIMKQNIKQQDKIDKITVCAGQQKIQSKKQKAGSSNKFSIIKFNPSHLSGLCRLQYRLKIKKLHEGFLIFENYRKDCRVPRKTVNISFVQKYLINLAEMVREYFPIPDNNNNKTRFRIRFSGSRIKDDISY